MTFSFVSALDARCYPTYANNWDDVLLRELLLRYIDRESVVLDLGAGAGILPQMDFRDCAKKVCGVDLEPRVVDNPYLDEGKLGRGEDIPYGAEEFDLVFANNVLEHLEDPSAVFKEVSRVLKPGGFFIVKTPNQYHYVPLLARLTPTAFHKFVNSLRGRAKEDSFPTFYRANSEGSLKTLAQNAGFAVEKVQLIEGRPEYLRFNALSYLLGLSYERVVNSTELLRHFRVLLVGVLRKG